MTSTPFNVGLNDGARLSSRVLRPPGGGHTDIFGGEPEPAPRGRRGGPPPAVTAHHIMEPKPTNGTTQNGQESQQPEQKSPEPEPESKPEPKPEPKSETKPEPAPAPVSSPTKAQPEPPKAEPPRRVRVPPGGFSSGLW